MSSYGKRRSSIRPKYQDIRPSGWWFVIAVIVSIALLVASRWEGFASFSQLLTRFVWPVQCVVNLPYRVIEVAQPLLNRGEQLVEQNNALHREYIYLQAQVQKLRALEAENQELRELLHSTSFDKESFSEGRLIHADIDPFSQQILLNKGKFQGIEVGQPVIDASGLVGLVIGLNEYTSRVLLLTDPSFAVPIQSVRSGERAIATGSGAGELRLNYVPRTGDFIEGDVLVTSGLGGRFPAGYPVGVITSIQHDPTTRFTLIGVSPSAKLGQLRHVLFVKIQKETNNIALIDNPNTPVVPTKPPEDTVPVPSSSPVIPPSDNVSLPTQSDIKHDNVENSSDLKLPDDPENPPPTTGHTE